MLIISSGEYVFYNLYKVDLANLGSIRLGTSKEFLVVPSTLIDFYRLIDSNIDSYLSFFINIRRPFASDKFLQQMRFYL